MAVVMVAAEVAEGPSEADWETGSWAAVARVAAWRAVVVKAKVAGVVAGSPARSRARLAGLGKWWTGDGGWMTCEHEIELRPNARVCS